MADQRVPIRRGIAKNLTLDPDAAVYLIELCGPGKPYGRYISGLLRAEYARREERQKVKAALLATLDPEGALAERTP